MSRAIFLATITLGWALFLSAPVSGQTAEERLRRLEQKQKEQTFSEAERAQEEQLSKMRQNRARQRVANNEVQQKRAQENDQERLRLLTKAVLEQQVQLAQSALLIADLGRQVGELKGQLEEIKGMIKRAPFAPAR